MKLSHYFGNPGTKVQLPLRGSVERRNTILAWQAPSEDHLSGYTFNDDDFTHLAEGITYNQTSTTQLYVANGALRSTINNRFVDFLDLPARNGMRVLQVDGIYDTNAPTGSNEQMIINWNKDPAPDPDEFMHNIISTSGANGYLIFSFGTYYSGVYTGRGTVNLSTTHQPAVFTYQIIDMGDLIGRQIFAYESDTAADADRTSLEYYEVNRQTKDATNFQLGFGVGDNDIFGYRAFQVFDIPYGS